MPPARPVNRVVSSWFAVQIERCWTNGKKIIHIQINYRPFECDRNIGWRNKGEEWFPRKQKKNEIELPTDNIWIVTAGSLPSSKLTGESDTIRQQTWILQLLLFAGKGLVPSKGPTRNRDRRRCDSEIHGTCMPISLSHKLLVVRILIFGARLLLQLLWNSVV